jgi:hypothetical protein
MGAVWVAVNDALMPFGAAMMHQPFTTGAGRIGKNEGACGELNLASAEKG